VVEPVLPQPPRLQPAAAAAAEWCVCVVKTQIVLEQKLHHGKGLPVESSWLMYLAETHGAGAK
jgi:hypothetical protein